MNILEFSRTISDDLLNYDINGACECKMKFHCYVVIIAKWMF